MINIKLDESDLEALNNIFQDSYDHIQEHCGREEADKILDLYNKILAQLPASKKTLDGGAKIGTIRNLTKPMRLL